MIFLGMKRKPKTKEELKNDPIKQAEATRNDRKNTQIQHWQEFEKEKENLEKEIARIEGDDI